METFLACLAAILLDKLLGEARKLHPLVGFGRLASRLEQQENSGAAAPSVARTRGALSVALLVLPFVFLAGFLTSSDGVGWLFGVVVLYVALGGTSLKQHAQQVSGALKRSELPLARQRVGYIVSRETSQMDEAAVSRATVESVLENGNDAVFGALFWFIVAGAPGVVLYRLINTLDAMWGYRTDRFRNFGWAAARLDDLLNWIPARLTAYTYALLGNFRLARHCLREQGRNWESPNAGPVMAAGAGSLEIQLGGNAFYHGALKYRPTLGDGRVAGAEDIDRACRLVDHGQWLWLGTILVIGGVFYA